MRIKKKLKVFDKGHMSPSPSKREMQRRHPETVVL